MLGMYKGGNIAGERNLGNKHYELTNHLGNVLAVVTDNINMANDLTTATVVSATDYYPFGLEMAGRTFSAEDYRYGFNGKEKDQNGEFGNTHYDYGFRIYNPEIGKFLSVDPLTKSYPMLTPYQFASNRPIDGVDLDGLEYYRGELQMVFSLAPFNDLPTDDDIYVNEKLLNSVMMGYAAPKLYDDGYQDQGTISVKRWVSNNNKYFNGKVAEDITLRYRENTILPSILNAIPESIVFFESYTGWENKQNKLSITSQANALNRSADLVFSVRDQFPDYIKNNNTIQADLVNYIADFRTIDNLNISDDEATNRAYREMISTIGAELYLNRDDIKKGSYLFPYYKYEETEAFNRLDLDVPNNGTYNQKSLKIREEFRANLRIAIDNFRDQNFNFNEVKIKSNK